MPTLNIKQRQQTLALDSLCAQTHYRRRPTHTTVLNQVRDILKIQKWSLLVLQNRFRESLETYNTLHAREDIIDILLQQLSTLDDVLADEYLKDHEVAYDVEDFLGMLASLVFWIHSAGDKHVKYEVDKGPEYFASLDESAAYATHSFTLLDPRKGKIHLKAWRLHTFASSLLFCPTFTVTTLTAIGSDGDEVPLHKALALSQGECKAAAAEMQKAKKAGIRREEYKLHGGRGSGTGVKTEGKTTILLGPKKGTGETIVKTGRVVKPQPKAKAKVLKKGVGNGKKKGFLLTFCRREDAGEDVENQKSQDVAVHE